MIHIDIYVIHLQYKFQIQILKIELVVGRAAGRYIS